MFAIGKFSPCLKTRKERWFLDNADRYNGCQPVRLCQTSSKARRGFVSPRPVGCRCPDVVRRVCPFWSRPREGCSAPKDKMCPCLDKAYYRTTRHRLYCSVDASSIFRICLLRCNKKTLCTSKNGCGSLRAHCKERSKRFYTLYHQLLRDNWSGYQKWKKLQKLDIWLQQRYRYNLRGRMWLRRTQILGGFVSMHE